MYSKIEKNIFSVLLIFSIIIIILTSSLLITIFDKRFYINFEKEKNNQSKQEHVENLLNYFQNNNKYIQDNSFNQREISHLYDVKNLIQKTYSTLLFFLILSISLLFYLFKTKNIKIITNSLIYGGTISLGIIILIIILFFPKFNWEIILGRTILFVTLINMVES